VFRDGSSRFSACGAHMMTVAGYDRRAPRWASLSASLRAIVIGLVIGLVGANVWPFLVLGLGAPLCAPAEGVFLAVYLWWVSGGGPPIEWRQVRRAAFRRRLPSLTQWGWGLLAALAFAATIHAALVLLFRLIPFPMAAFREGYDLSAIPSRAWRWIAVVIAATSAGVCEETGFRGYMQRPIEQRHGVLTAVMVSSAFFTVVHVTKAWALVGMVPIVFGAGVLLGLLAWASDSLIFGMIGHVVMDIGLFAYWWTGIAGEFTARPISETGADQPFLIACLAFATSLFMVVLAICRLRRTRADRRSPEAAARQFAVHDENGSRQH